MNSVENQQICSRFVAPEKLANLRTRQEIEVMNGRPWTRELPPPPVLPPYGPLEKINGRIESFRSEYYREYFDANAYRTHSLPEITDGQRGAAAGAAIVAGSPGVGAVMMAESESSNDSAEYVQGMINGQPFRGWVGVTRLQAGDNVDMVVEWQHDHYEVYAIALPKERIVSICPKCDMGHIAHMLWRIKNMIILTAILIFMFACICLVKSLNEVGWGQLNFWKEYFVFLMMMLGLAFLFTGAIAIAAYKTYSSTCCKLAEEIFQLLGVNNFVAVNLNKLTQKREKKMMQKREWYDPGDKNKPACPSSKFIYSGEWWFYY
ncbi:hypothetical protein FMJ45_28375 [Klebsiella michiganensis]|uniref:Type VI secretion system effector n=3 Tax=Klebsiella/Raoultella group TaxID=2890311 RepID=A0AB35WBT4_9ENTR|nr:putative type VI secretion system effector [Klebsiella michiganensis]ELR9568847.1 hypothetical protein [Klebsiella michiganensis]ELT9703307.1 hypothetical protein [Klebsiella michiganensis]MBF8474997.1 hypothetical protein [Klebsiella michiganensis]MBL0815008.1 hypothetical protein [Klebsiella michiganensis]MBZ6605037.1 hypothetical protein [Klebsiella michiganensis]